MYEYINENKYTFDAVGMERFVYAWNRLIEKYGFVSVYDLFDDIFLLGGYYMDEKCPCFTDVKFGWSKPISETSAFEVKKKGRKYTYTLRLSTPEC